MLPCQFSCFLYSGALVYKIDRLREGAAAEKLRIECTLCTSPFCLNLRVMSGRSSGNSFMAKSTWSTEQTIAHWYEHTLLAYLLTGAVEMPLLISFNAGLPSSPLVDVKSNTSSTI